MKLYKLSNAIHFPRGEISPPPFCVDEGMKLDYTTENRSSLNYQKSLIPKPSKFSIKRTLSKLYSESNWFVFIFSLILSLYSLMMSNNDKQ
jgi:hypothetical protein